MMEKLIIFKFLLLGCLYQTVLMAGHTGSIQLTIDESRARIGGQVTLTCVTSGVQGKVLIGKVVNVDGSDTVNEVISSNTDLYPRYSTTGRFKMSTDPYEGNSATFYLHIKDVKAEDSATYVCNELDTDVTSEQLLEVFTLPSSVSFTDVPQMDPKTKVLEFLDGEPREVSGLVEGGVPLPMLHLKLAGKNLKTKVNKQVTMKLPDCYAKKQCLLHYTTSMAVSVPQLTLDSSADDQLLTWDAHLHGAGMTHVNSSVRVSVLYAPQLNCSKQQVVDLHSKNAQIICRVKCNPQLQTVLFSFKWHGIPEVLHPDSRTDDNEYHMTMQRINKKEAIVKLTISKVYSRHLIPYSLQASNQHGSTSLDMHLFSTDSFPNKGTAMKSSSPLFVLVLLLSIMFA